MLWPLAVLSVAAGALAQTDPTAVADEEPAAAQPAADDEPEQTFWLTTGDLRIRGDWLSRGSAPGISRGRVSVRPGAIWLPSASLELGAALRLAAGTDDAIVGTDNEENEGIRLDQAFLRWFPGAGSAFSIGKAENEIWLTPMVWDRDLRPVGVAYSYERTVRTFDSVRVVAALYAGDHLFDDESRISAVQATWLIREGASRSGELALAYLQFDDLERLVQSGLSRTNRTSEGRLISDFELLNLQIAGRLPFARGSLEARLDQIVNLGANDEDRGTRVSLSWSQEIEPVRFEAGLIAQRIQRDAVMAAFNSDDWWFHSAVRGVSAWFGFHPRRDVTIRFGGFSERLDGNDTRFKRLLLDLELAW